MPLHFLKASELNIGLINIVPSVIDTEILLFKHIVREIISESPHVRPVCVIGSRHPSN